MCPYGMENIFSLKLHCILLCSWCPSFAGRKGSRAQMICISRCSFLNGRDCNRRSLCVFVKICQLMTCFGSVSPSCWTANYIVTWLSVLRTVKKELSSHSISCLQTITCKSLNPWTSRLSSHFEKLIKMLQLLLQNAICWFFPFLKKFARYVWPCLGRQSLSTIKKKSHLSGMLMISSLLPCSFESNKKINIQ